MNKSILILLMLFNLSAFSKSSNKIPVAIINGEVDRVSTLLRTPISKHEKSKYLELASLLKQKYSITTYKPYSKFYHFGISGITLIAGIVNIHNAYQELESLDDLRKKIVIWYLAQAGACLAIGVEKIRRCYLYYINNYKYKNAVEIEYIVKNCLTE